MNRETEIDIYINYAQVTNGSHHAYSELYSVPLWYFKWEGNPKRRELYVNVWLTPLYVQQKHNNNEATIHQ